MLLILQLLNDALDGFAKKELQGVQREFSNKNILSLDNFSDQWLINATYEEIKKESEADIIIIRDNEAEFNNLQQLLHQLPQLKQSKILYSGIKHPLIERMSNFKNIKIKTADTEASLLQQATDFFIS